MAELLIKAVDSFCNNTIQDKAGSYKKWDIVVIQEDNHSWGLAEGLPKFFIIKVQGTAKEDLITVIDSKEIIVVSQENWNKLDYDLAILSDNWQNFIETPEVLDEVSESKTIEVSNEVWDKMQGTANYFPFYELPFDVVNVDTVELTGDIVTITLSGNTKIVETRRKFKITESNLTDQQLNDLNSSGITSVNLNELENLIIDKESLLPIIL